jgi:hypothetical protein
MAVDVMRFLSKVLNHNPLVRAFKNIRNETVDSLYRKAGLPVDLSVVAGLGARDSICVAIAYNTPWCIDLLASLWPRFVVGTTLLVADNSSRADARQEIERICADRGVAYISLPWNPEWSPNRSHGLAMNWIVCNVIDKLSCDLWGFIDHDCFPQKSFSFEAVVPSNGVFGLRKASSLNGAYWNLWAGFCFFRQSLTRGKRLDFKHRVELGLDTGGGNWCRLYESLSEEQTRFANQSGRIVTLGDSSVSLQFIEDSFVHLGGASYRQNRFENGAEFARFLSF